MQLWKRDSNTRCRAASLLNTHINNTLKGDGGRSDVYDTGMHGLNKKMYLAFLFHDVTASVDAYRKEVCVNCKLLTVE